MVAKNDIFLQKILENVHFRISLRKMLKIVDDNAIYRRKLCQSRYSLNLRLKNEILPNFIILGRIIC